MTVRELLEAFLASPHRWTPTTWRTHTGEARMLCRDHLGRARLDRLTHNTVERAIARWVHFGASPALISARFRVLHSAISWALRNKLIISDPLDGMQTPSRPHPRLHLRPGEVHQLVVTVDEAVEKARARLAERPHARQRVLDLFLAEQNALLVRLAADSGARRGELAALLVSDLQGRVLSIARASQDGVIGPVKNHLNRRFNMVDAAQLEQLAREAIEDGVQQFVVGGIVEHDGKVLLLQRPSDDFMGGIFELPSGKVEGDESLDAALTREVKEETGLDVATIREYLGSFDYTSGSGKKSRQFNFAVTIARPEPVELQEHDTYVWMPLDDELPVTDAVKDIVQAYGQLRTL